MRAIQHDCGEGVLDLDGGPLHARSVCHGDRHLLRRVDRSVCLRTLSGPSAASEHVLRGAQLSIAMAKTHHLNNLLTLHEKFEEINQVAFIVYEGSQRE